MIELLYPPHQAPQIPSPRAYMAESRPVAKEEMLPIVEPAGVVIGQSCRSYVHGGSKLLHPVVHLHIIDRFGRIFLQKRAMSKKLHPGKWDTAVGGHVGYGESIQEALYRETHEELNFYDFNPIFLRAYVYENDAEKELISVFAAVGNFDLHPATDEVTEGRYWTEAEIAKALGTGVLTPNFEQEYALLHDSLVALL